MNIFMRFAIVNTKNPVFLTQMKHYYAGHSIGIRRQSTTDEILIARGFRRESTTEDLMR